ncbi:autophagy-related protein 22-1 [Aspergillus udagawae]|uniref:Autophagy-related protein n=1 Tax=Aspergillus udagawae TaxID=91492 RepID=A0A8H3XN67_9EURO|nr:autophagy protein 22 [Aspergillus udagawae]GFF53648.1 autophagy-related protein 22-1 [Aspergillus udagawae]GFF61935.1 autophagy-related protein 22-1 [Aspergillus udagawae]GFG00114.1 autophagy-related protein 22-1 [Aspergillus udagawae]GFG19453.1 autophagy-related protein 22-1 [Aspergillus udagawae]GIC84903.1 autophagy protein 22 [Aspergillus udagawae]
MRALDEAETSMTRPQYPGDDTRPTSKKELAGWYSYGWAAEVFTVCAMGSFLPITLEQMARDRGVLLSDKVTSCGATLNGPSKTSTQAQWTLSSRYDAGGPTVVNQCVVYIFGVEINTASFAMYTFSVSVFIQALLIISMSGAADHGSHRKLLLVAFAVIGSVSTMLFLGVVPKIYIVGAVIAIIANTCFGASFVLLNSFLPLLIRHHPSVLRGVYEPPHALDGSRAQEGHSDSTNDIDHGIDSNATSPLLHAHQGNSENAATDLRPAATITVSQELKLSTQISSFGIGIGYIGAIILQIVCILVVIATNQTTFSLRLVLFLIGLWWFIFTIPAALWLRPRPGPPLTATHQGKHARSWIGYMAYAWKSLYRTAVRTRHLKDILLFLAAWFLLSDGIATVSGTAVLFAKTQLNMQPAALGLINVIAMMAGVLGAFSWGSVSRVFNLNASQTIIACILLFELVPLYGLLGFIPAIKSLGFLGLQQPWEMFPLGIVYGLVMGGLSSYCRSFFGELIPPGNEAAFYALYAITDKGSSIFGPAIVGIITDRYGEIRPAFVFLAVLIFLPLPLMLLVDVERGKRDALALAAELQPSGAQTYGTLPGPEDRAPPSEL